MDTAPEIAFNKTVCLVGNRNVGKTNAATALVLMPNLLGAQSDVIIAFCNGASYLQWKFLEGPRLPHRVYPELKETFPGIPMLLVATKCDARDNEDDAICQFEGDSSKFERKSHFLQLLCGWQTNKTYVTFSMQHVLFK